ncbi:FK506-binding protein 3-like [Spinacia oleracea]|uniref:FK506-binding protein 3-like n=1 Tax=Spinacia oleracea TaxID=3562 RepID=A0ABM3QYT6_SPIOL|nr:FK506-binding protein 3-like [Spinacia oleracea]
MISLIENLEHINNSCPNINYNAFLLFNRQEVIEEDENINNDEIVASPPKRMKRKSIAPKTKVRSVTIEKQDEDPVEKDDEETDDDILISQFRVARTQPPRKRTKKQEKKDEKDVEKRGKGVVQKKAAKALGTRTPTRRSLRVQESVKAVEEEEEEREIVKETKRKVGRKPRKTVKKEESDISEEDE